MELQQRRRARARALIDTQLADYAGTYTVTEDTDGETLLVHPTVDWDQITEARWEEVMRMRSALNRSHELIIDRRIGEVDLGPMVVRLGALYEQAEKIAGFGVHARAAEYPVLLPSDSRPSPKALAAVHAWEAQQGAEHGTVKLLLMEAHLPPNLSKFHAVGWDTSVSDGPGAPWVLAPLAYLAANATS
ncbi:hypothetical protein ACOQFV_24175 [Nocardiopsis changdeensis]|uniref:Uncharacterized protein n=1 Tax=Nocardiopsis changdeensis TaxID=2831969 RepID=A0A975KUI3_9ACTN|nr:MULTISPECIES: hypothetical protein [Nocardiopsis]QUX26508.1 hypothetical protein KGD84_32950 [Nocardiopsis changdeensis]QYX40780.1 hypothetical protein K1J57_32800 [Nocardiopsis sp. MT53]